ncbi:MAG: thioredoxin family protein [Rhodopirellula sp.]|nr:thioredoxin family protein [Rhodopirellula sp.]
MISQRFRFVVFASAALLWLTVGLIDVEAAKFNRVVNIGDSGPVWRNLRGVDGKTHSLDDLKKAKAVVVVFTCNHCPVAQAYEQRLIKLAMESRKKGVETVAISVSRYEADNFESMKKRSTELKYPFAYLQDTTQEIGRSYGALWTPSIFLLDSKRRIAYMGSIDDSMYREKVEREFLEDAIDAVLAGKPIDVEETKPVGCPIDYE